MKKVWNLFAVILCILFTTAGVLVSLNKFWQYDVFYFDFGIYDQAIWNVSRLKPPVIDHLVVSGKWIFADHFNPSIFILSPLYWLTDKIEVILVAQASLVGLSGLILYLIGWRILKSRFLSLIILFCYLFFVGIQNAVISDFHDTTASTLFLMLAFWGIIAKKKIFYFLMLFLTLGFKESNFLLGIGIGIFIFMAQKEWRKIALATFAISLIWGFASINFIIPYFSNGIYQYSYSLTGINYITGFFDEAVKRRTLFYSFSSFGFLPIISPSFWALIFQDFLIRFIPLTPTRWDLGLHYSAQLAVIMAVSSMYAIKILRDKIIFFRKYMHIFALILILNSFYLYQFVLHGPFALSYNKAFYPHSNDFEFLNKMIRQIPPEAVVMTQNNIAPRFTHQKVWLLRNNYSDYKPDYILIDNREGQNPNDFFASPNDISDIIEKLKKEKRYRLIYQTREQFIFKKV